MVSYHSADRKKLLCEKALRVDATCLVGWVPGFGVFRALGNSYF